MLLMKAVELFQRPKHCWPEGARREAGPDSAWLVRTPSMLGAAFAVTGAPRSVGASLLFSRSFARLYPSPCCVPAASSQSRSSLWAEECSAWKL